jgi:hypothetical protein
VFTIDEANATLPLVRAITSDLVKLSREVVDRRQRLQQLTVGRKLEPGDPYSDELVHVQEELEKDTERIEDYLKELLELGVEPKSATEGLIDFPSVMDGRRVYLCWKLGEPEVMYWHEVEGGYSGRQPLALSAVS